MSERACPRCHLQVPPDLLAKRPYFVSVVGAPGSGKTYFLTAMLHGLRQDLARYFGYSLVDSDSHFARAFLDYERELFFPTDPNRPTLLQKTQETGALYNVVRLDGVDVQLPKPFIFTLSPTESNADVARHGEESLRQNVVLYDNAGESFDLYNDKARAGNNRSTHHLGECDSMLFAFDPLQDPAARQRLAAVSQDPQLSSAAKTFRQETILQEVVHRIRRQRGIEPGQRLEVALGVCVQKYDVWQSLVPYSNVANGEAGSRSVIDASSIEFIEARGIAGLDVEEINAISLLIRSLIEDLCPQFVAIAEANFNVVRYFPVSALGTSPEYDTSRSAATPGAPASVTGDMLKVRPANLQPFRVTHPMLWLMNRWKLIHRIRPRTDRAARYRNAKIESVTPDRMRIITPAGRILSLDKSYSGSSVIDPYCGEMIWIPELAAEAAVATPPAPTRPAALKLKLDEPAKTVRKGWFKR